MGTNVKQTKKKNAAPALTDAEKVTAHIGQLDTDIAAIVQYIRNMILETDSSIGEQIKWNSPSFYYTGPMKDFDPKEYKRDIIVMNLNKGRILLVFPTGARIKDSTGLLEGNYTDGRRLMTVKDMQDALAKEKRLKKIIKDWLKGIEK